MRFRFPVILGAAIPLTAGLAALGVAGPRRSMTSLPVSDFESGLQGWWTNDALFHARKTPTTTLISIERVPEPDGGHVLHICFHPGEGWASAAVNFADEGDAWADAGVDAVRPRVRGDGSAKSVTMGVQAWADDLVTPIMFEVPVSLRQTEWHTVVLLCAELEASRPPHRLRLRSLISFQVNGAGSLGPAELWIDDVEAVNAEGSGKPYAESPLADRVRRAATPSGLPRLGNWAYPGRDNEALRQCKELGIGFSSNGDSTIQQQRVFIEGIVTSHSIGRPSGEELIAGLGLADEDLDQDERGLRSGEGIVSTVFDPRVLARYLSFVRKRVRARRDAKWVQAFVISSPVSMYGEVHYPASTEGGYLVFGRAAKRNFQEWLRRRYAGDLSRLNSAWRSSFPSWESLVPPKGPVDDGTGLDRRLCWSDFMHWYNGWLDEVTVRSVQVVRRETCKPIALMLGGPKVGLSQGIALGNIGPVARTLSRYRPAFLSDTDSQTLFSARYSRAACSQYGIRLMLEHVGPPYLQAFHQVNTLHNVLACGGDYVHLATLGELFTPSHWFHRIWHDLAPEVLHHRTGYVRSDAAMFHSYLTSWFRPSRSNADCVMLYDATNTLWFWDKGYPSWGRALGSPDILDDAMVEDGGLRGRRLLVIPNTGMTVTSRKAVAAIRKWVAAGGRVVGFGKGCLEYVLEADGSLTHDPYFGGMVPASTVEAAARDAVIEQRYGRGTVVLDLRPADPGSEHAPDSMGFLQRQAELAGVRFWCHVRPAWDANLLYCGRDHVSRRLFFVLDLTKRVFNGGEGPEFWKNRTFELQFDPSLRGDAELVAITDSFVSARGATAIFDRNRRVLHLRFRLPTHVTIEV